MRHEHFRAFLRTMAVVGDGIVRVPPVHGKNRVVIQHPLLPRMQEANIITRCIAIREHPREIEQGHPAKFLAGVWSLAPLFHAPLVWLDKSLSTYCSKLIGTCAVPKQAVSQLR